MFAFVATTNLELPASIVVLPGKAQACPSLDSKTGTPSPSAFSKFHGGRPANAKHPSPRFLSVGTRVATCRNLKSG